MRRIGQTYDVRGLLTTTTSYADPDGLIPVNEVANSYNEFGQLVEQPQEHSGVVTGGSPRVQIEVWNVPSRKAETHVIRKAK